MQKNRQQLALSLALVFLVNILLISLIQTVQAATYSQGSSGETVRTIQTKLKRWGYYSGTVDGIYGSGTVSAVKYFQQKNGLAPDGVAGPATLQALGIYEGTSSGGTNSSQSASLDLLAKVISAEARGEPYSGQVAVGAVILNRVNHPSFPNTIAGVVYQAGAFDAVYDGQINLTPDSDSIRAAKDALNGWDPTGGCLYYYNPSTATNGWIWTRTVQLSIGKHNFAI